MTDQELIARAERAGWKWYDNEVPPIQMQMRSTGWHETEAGSFRNCKRSQKITCLRNAIHCVEPGRGFDHELDCRECGKPIWLGWLANTEATLIKYLECLRCNHWLDIIRAGAALVIDRDRDGVHVSVYHIGTLTTPSSACGFGGSWHTIRYLDSGKVVKTCDLWHQGVIPERFRGRLPVTAEFWDYPEELMKQAAMKQQTKERQLAQE